jgi:Peptidase family M20/M25/M40
MTEMASSVVSGLEPATFWAHFEALTRIARPSRQEEPAIEHVHRWAGEHGFDVEQDEGRNVVVRVPATAGRESAPTVVLQGHLDMVCERDPASPNDPAEGRIELIVDGEWLTADGTTLGADDGVAIAAMMALVDDPSLPHGPLELLMTVAEEVGLDGANALDGSLVTESTLVNLDSEEDGVLIVGCAGSTDTWIRIEAPGKLRRRAQSAWRSRCPEARAGISERARRQLVRPCGSSRPAVSVRHVALARCARSRLRVYPHASRSPPRCLGHVHRDRTSTRCKRAGSRTPRTRSGGPRCRPRPRRRRQLRRGSNAAVAAQLIVPSVLMLVPGSAGYIRVLRLVTDETINGITAGFDTFVTAISILTV